MKKTKNKQLNVRIPPITQEQLQMIEEKTGMTQTQAIIVAIDRLAADPGRRSKRGEHETKTNI